MRRKNRIGYGPEISFLSLWLFVGRLKRNLGRRSKIFRSIRLMIFDYMRSCILIACRDAYMILYDLRNSSLNLSKFID